MKTTRRRLQKPNLMLAVFLRQDKALLQMAQPDNIK
jgi:hypothetical protein